MEFIHPAMNAARLAVKSLPKQLPVKVPIIDTFFEVKKPVEESPSSPSSSDSERFSLSTRTNARSGKKIYSIYPDSPAEKSILNFYDEKYNFDKSDSLFCLFNPSFSTLPEKFLERRCRRLLILDSSKKSCDYWRRFKSNYADGDASAEINVEQLDFTHLPNQTLSDLKKGQPNTFGQILRKYGCRPQVYADEKAEAQANFIGVLPFFK
uniref:Uncharacterized protein n=1 Tax=Romanomermis culicivorax TaxID=13658 RepID=A0A915IV53_ROMCU